MFMINRFGKWIFGDGSKESLIEVPEGQLYLVRPLSVKGYSELIYKDARAAIRRTSTEFNYQLVVTRAYEEGEEELLAEEEGEEADPDASDSDEQAFLLDESLQFRVDIRDTGEKVFAWRDLSGAAGDLWEFVCDRSTKPETVEAFEIVALRCQYERKHKRNADNASEKELQQFSFQDEPIPTASPLLSPTHSHNSRSPTISPSPTSTRLHTETSTVTNTMPEKITSTKALAKTPAKAPAMVANTSAIRHPEGRESISREVAELHLYDVEDGAFHLKSQAVEAVILDLGNFDYWLKVTSANHSWIGVAITDNLSPVFNFEFLSAIFNVADKDGNLNSWLLRFKETAVIERFQQGLMQAIWEHANQMKWLKLKETDQDYVLDAFKDLTMEDAAEEEAEEEDEEDEEQDVGVRSEEYDSDESADEVVKPPQDGNYNSQLAVGYKHDRSFVVRGSKIGVFKHTPDNHLEFATNISKVATPKGKLFSPKKVMLHAQDQNLILQNPNDPNSVYRMDLEVGKVVDEWKIHDEIPITYFTPEDKFAQMTDQQTFLGINDKSMYRVDPRLAGSKLVDADMKTYANSTKTGFTTASTTEKGYIAVGSANGDIRLFDRLGIRAKTQLPALGDNIIGLDVSADGRWVLATTDNYLLLIDAMQHDGKDSGKLGFEKSFPASAKPKPRRLALTPSHIAQFVHETQTPIKFTPAKFNTGPSVEESSIITSTGPFIVTWNLKKVLKGQKDPYNIKRYAEEVKADNFRFGTDKNIVVALPNEVDMVMKKALKRPTRESIAPPRLSGARASTPARKSRGYLGKSDIVNSPY